MRQPQQKPYGRNGQNIAPINSDMSHNLADIEEVVRAIDTHTAVLSATNENLAILAGAASETLAFIKTAFSKWLPIAVVVAGFAWPTSKKLIDAIAVAAGVGAG